MPLSFSDITGSEGVTGAWACRGPTNLALEVSGRCVGMQAHRGPCVLLLLRVQAYHGPCQRCRQGECAGNALSGTKCMAMP